MSDWTQIHTKFGARYPYQAKCPCGWRSRGYVKREAAETMADAHDCDYGKDDR